MKQDYKRKWFNYCTLYFFCIRSTSVVFNGIVWSWDIKRCLSSYQVVRRLKIWSNSCLWRIKELKRSLRVSVCSCNCPNSTYRDSVITLISNQWKICTSILLITASACCRSWLVKSDDKVLYLPRNVLKCVSSFWISRLRV
jgi:hypothetical protein